MVNRADPGKLIQQNGEIASSNWLVLIVQVQTRGEYRFFGKMWLGSELHFGGFYQDTGTVEY